MRELEHRFKETVKTLPHYPETGEEVSETLNWLKKCEQNIEIKIEKTTFPELRQWNLADDESDIKHESGKFFSIEAVRVSSKIGNQKLTWDQPIINQPEVGILGYLAKRVGDKIYFLVQAKVEPGNPKLAQISPTVQATKSNYTQVHGGTIPPYLDYFTSATIDKIQVDTLQSEQGKKFFRKKNRNIVVWVDNKLEDQENFRWVSYDALKQLMKSDLVVNMDSRTVFACFAASISNNSENESNTSTTEDWIDSYRKSIEYQVQKIALSDCKDWKLSDQSFRHINRAEFSVTPIAVKIESREVKYWDQPILEHHNCGVIGLIVKKKTNSLHFLVRLYAEPGIENYIAIGPTFQSETKENTSEYYQWEIVEELKLSASNSRITHSSFQSEEGGRFLNFISNYLIIEANNEIPDLSSDKFRWMNRKELDEALVAGLLNIEIRNLLAIYP